MKKHTMLSEIWRRFKKNKQAVVGLIVLIIFILVAIFAKQIAPYWYDDQDASRAMIGPCAQYPFGTDNLGRDVLSRLIYGSRYSLSIGFLAVGISVLTGGVDFSNWKIVLKAAAAGADGAIDASTEIAIRYGAFLATILDFLIIAFAVFLMLKAINGFHDKLKKAEEEAPAKEPVPPEPSNEEKLLTEIRDLLKARK